jgi:hypothetical protein
VKGHILREIDLSVKIMDEQIDGRQISAIRGCADRGPEKKEKIA